MPINSPVNLTAYNVSSREIEVTWDYNEDPRLVLGNLLGFLLYFVEANARDYFTEDAVLKTHTQIHAEVLAWGDWKYSDCTTFS